MGELFATSSEAGPLRNREWNNQELENEKVVNRLHHSVKVTVLGGGVVDPLVETVSPYESLESPFSCAYYSGSLEGTTSPVLFLLRLSQPGMQVQ